ncbi:MAG: hypothetical protein ACRC3H_12970 [Lachnospiraceae bacterium]
MAAGVFIVLWSTITPAQIPFPSSDTLTGTNAFPSAGTTIYVTNISGARYYNNPTFVGITIKSNGLSGGNARTLICFEPDMEGKKIKVYVSFASTCYAFEVQVWAAGCWQIQNPGSGPATPNSLTFGNPVGIFEDFGSEERDPAHPPPTNNPFIPWLAINIETLPGVCALTAPIRVTLNQISTVNIVSATVLKDGVNTGVTLAQLVAGFTFTTPGIYSVVVVYRFLGNGTTPGSTTDETFTRTFTISATPFPHMQRQSLVSGYIAPGEPLLFDTAVVDNSTISYNTLNGEFTRNFCADYFIKWFIVPRAGFTTDGVNFAISINGSTDAVGSSDVRISPTVGFSIVKVNAAPPILRLVNLSDDIVFLSDETQIVAGIVIFKIGEEMPLTAVLNNSMEGGS